MTNRKICPATGEKHETIKDSVDTKYYEIPFMLIIDLIRHYEKYMKKTKLYTKLDIYEPQLDPNTMKKVNITNIRKAEIKRDIQINSFVSTCTNLILKHEWKNNDRGSIPLQCLDRFTKMYFPKTKCSLLKMWVGETKGMYIGLPVFIKIGIKKNKKNMKLNGTIKYFTDKKHLIYNYPKNVSITSKKGEPFSILLFGFIIDKIKILNDTGSVDNRNNEKTLVRVYTPYNDMVHDWIDHESLLTQPKANLKNIPRIHTKQTLISNNFKKLKNVENFQEVKKKGFEYLKKLYKDFKTKLLKKTGYYIFTDDKTCKIENVKNISILEGWFFVVSNFKDKETLLTKHKIRGNGKSFLSGLIPFDTSSTKQIDEFIKKYGNFINKDSAIQRVASKHYILYIYLGVVPPINHHC